MYAPKLPDKNKMPDIYAILIVGERGSGKEFVAKRIAKMWHDNGLQTKCSINCATIVPELACSELFGHVRGAFTGAIHKTAGLFGQYKKEKIFFLDELHRLPVDAQGALLRLVEYHEYKKVGKDAEKLNKKNWPRIIAAVQPKALNDDEVLLPDLEDRFVYTVKVPSLSYCPFLIPRLFAIFLYDTYKNVFYRKYNLKKNKNIQDIEAKSVREAFKRLKFPEIDLWNLMAYAWPSNIRELKHEALQTRINNKNIIEMTLFYRISSDRNKAFKRSFELMFGVFGKTKNRFKVNKRTFKNNNYEREGIKFINPLPKEPAYYKTYETNKKLTLLDLWNYKTFKEQYKTNKNVPLMFASAGLFALVEDDYSEQYNRESKLIDEALISAKRKLYEKQAFEMLSNPKEPQKPNSLKKLEQLHKNFGTWEKVAEHFEVAKNTVYVWKRKFMQEEK